MSNPMEPMDEVEADFIDYDPDITGPEAPHPDITIGVPPASISADEPAPVHPHASPLTVTAHTKITAEPTESEES